MPLYFVVKMSVVSNYSDSLVTISHWIQSQCVNWNLSKNLNLWTYIELNNSSGILLNFKLSLSNFDDQSHRKLLNSTTISLKRLTEGAGIPTWEASSSFSNFEHCLAIKFCQKFTQIHFKEIQRLLFLKDDWKVLFLDLKIPLQIIKRTANLMNFVHIRPHSNFLSAIVINWWL